MTIKKLHRYRLDCDGPDCDVSLIVEADEKWPKPEAGSGYRADFPDDWLEVETRGYGFGQGTTYVFCPKCKKDREDRQNTGKNPC